MQKSITINQALREIATLKGKVNSARTNLASSNVWTGTSAPAYSYSESYANIKDVLEKLTRLQTAVAISNAKTKINEGGVACSIVEAILALSNLKSLISDLKCLATLTTKTAQTPSVVYDAVTSQMRNTTVENHCSLTTRERDALIETLQSEFDNLNSLVEKSNHVTMISV